MIANRKAVKASFRRLYRSSKVRDVEHYGRILLATLRELSPPGRSDPTVALLTPGVYNSAFYAYVPDMIRYYLGEEPLLANVETLLCRRPEDLEHTLDNLDRLVVKRVGESGGYGMLVGPHATPRERAEYARQVRATPADFIAQPTLALSRAPCLVDGRFEPRHVDLRPFVLHGRETRIVPGAFCRVALRRGSLVVNSSQGGGGKDLWVLGD